MFMNFIRYVDVLAPTDIRKLKGQMLRDRVFELEKYQTYKNQSLNIFDNESYIHEEGGFDEGTKRVFVTNRAPVQSKAHLKDFDINILHQQLKDGLQYGIIEYLRAYKISDLMFIRGGPGSSHNIYTFNLKDLLFHEFIVPDHQFNILQLAVLGGHYDLVKYIMLEHKIFSNTRQPRNIDPRIIMFNHHDESDDTLTLRMAIQANNLDIFKLLWDFYPQIYTERHLIMCAQFCFRLQRYHFLVHLLSSPTSTPIFLSSSVEGRAQLVDLFDNQSLAHAQERSIIIQLIG
jgi:hypothetical protein